MTDITTATCTCEPFSCCAVGCPVCERERDEAVAALREATRPVYTCADPRHDARLSTPKEPTDA